MPESSKKYRLNFVIQGGIAKGFKATLEQQTINFHVRKYGDNRPELNDADFIDKDIKEALENPDAVYPSLYIDNSGNTLPKKNVYVFYKEKVERRYTKNGITVKWYTKVVVRKKWLRKLDVITPYYSSKINEEKRCKPITKI